MFNQTSSFTISWPRRRLALPAIASAMLILASTAAGQQPPKKEKLEPKPATTAGPVVSSAIGKPKALVEEPVHDFGVIWSDNKELLHTFVVKNIGDTPLKILRVKPTCGCTKAGEHPKEIAPGKSGEFPFKLRTRGLRTGFKKTIRITTDDPTEPMLQLQLTGSVKHYVQAEPNMAYFNNIFGAERHEKIIKITNNTETPLKLTLPENSNGSFKFDLKEVEPGKQFDLTIYLEPPYEPGRERETLNIKTNIEKQPVLNVRLNAVFSERIDVRPSPLVIPESDREIPRVVLVRNNGSTPVNVLDVTVNDDSVLADKVTWKARKAGFSYQVQVVIPPNHALPKEGRNLLIKTDDKEKPEIVVPMTPRPTRTARANRAQSKNSAQALVGKPAPAIKAAMKSGKILTNDDMKDKVTVLNFFSANCGWCKRQLPQVDKTRKSYEGNDNVQFVNISQTMRKPNTDEEVAKLLGNLKVGGELVTDPSNSLGDRFNVNNGYPKLFVVGKDGKVAEVFIGAKADLDAGLKSTIDKALGGGHATKKENEPRTRIRLDGKLRTANTSSASAVTKKSDTDSTNSQSVSNEKNDK